MKFYIIICMILTSPLIGMGCSCHDEDPVSPCENTEPLSATTFITAHTQVCGIVTSVSFAVEDKGHTYNWSATAGAMVQGSPAPTVTVDFTAATGPVILTVTAEESCENNPAAIEVEVDLTPPAAITGVELMAGGSF